MKAKVPFSKFVKPYSKGQITIPQDFREYLDIDENSWLKISLLRNKIIVEPAEESEKARIIKPKVDMKTYLKRILKIKGNWFDEKETKVIRKEIEARLAKNEENLT